MGGRWAGGGCLLEHSQGLDRTRLYGLVRVDRDDHRANCRVDVVALEPLSKRVQHGRVGHVLELVFLRVLAVVHLT